jgi:DNA-binding transcriptional LysR family regulator
MSGFDSIRLEDLRFLDRVALHGSITAAAKELGLPKPTASRRLAQLERRVGQSLVHRSTRHLALTEPGEAFLKRARNILAQADSARLALECAEPQGTLRVSIPVPLGRMFGGRVIADFRRRLPGVQLEIHLQNERVELLRDRFDLAIRGGALPDSELLARRLAMVPLLLYVSRAHAQHDLAEIPFIAAPGDVALIRRTLSVRLNPAVLIDDRIAINEALDCGAGAGVLPAFLGEPSCREGLLQRHHDQPLSSLPVHAVFLPAQRDDVRVLTLIRVITEGLQETLGSERSWE